jgi:hypothetical protein
MKIDMDPSVCCGSDCFPGTGMYTFLTVQAVVTVVHDLYSGELGLRIGTPFAAKGTPLQENRGPDPRPVVNRKLLYVKDDSFRFHTKYPLHKKLHNNHSIHRKDHSDAWSVLHVLIIASAVGNVNNKFHMKFIKIIFEIYVDKQEGDVIIKLRTERK